MADQYMAEYVRFLKDMPCVEVERSLQVEVGFMNDVVAKVDALNAEKEKRVKESRWVFSQAELQRYTDFKPWGGKPGRGDRNQKMRA